MAVLARTREQAEQTVAELRPAPRGSEAHAIAGDVADEAQVRAAAAEFRRH